MRILAQILVFFIGIFILVALTVGLGFFAGVQTNNPLVGIGSGLFTFVIITLFLSKVIMAMNTLGRVNMKSWLSSVAGYPYKVAYDGTGVAVDNIGRQIHLVCRNNGKTVSRAYSFSEVREWGYVAPGASKIMTFGNVGATVAAVNVASAFSAAEQTGLWVKVKDVEFPRWFIKFGHLSLKGKAQSELDRWMEILTQAINEM